MGAAVESEDIDFAELVSLIDALEDSGHQHVFLYRLAEDLLAELRDPARIAEYGSAEDVEVNAMTRILEMPPEPTCVSVRQSDEELRIRWVEKREWYEVIKDERTGDRRIREWKVHKGRAVNVFRVDLGTGAAELRISDAGKQRRNDYLNKETEYAGLLASLLNWDTLERLRLDKAIPGVIHSGEVNGTFLASASSDRVEIGVDVLDRLWCPRT